MGSICSFRGAVRALLAFVGVLDILFLKNRPSIKSVLVHFPVKEWKMDEGKQWLKTASNKEICKKERMKKYA